MSTKKSVRKSKAVDPRNDQAMADLMEQVAAALGPIADRCPAFAPPHQCQPIKDLADKVLATAKEFRHKVDHPDPAPSCPWGPPETPPQEVPPPVATTTPPAAATPSGQATAPSPAPANQPVPPTAPCPCRGQASPTADDVPNAETTAEPPDPESKP